MKNSPQNQTVNGGGCGSYAVGRDENLVARFGAQCIGVMNKITYWESREGRVVIMPKEGKSRQESCPPAFTEKDYAWMSRHLSLIPMELGEMLSMYFERKDNWELIRLWAEQFYENKNYAPQLMLQRAMNLLWHACERRRIFDTIPPEALAAMTERSRGTIVDYLYNNMPSDKVEEKWGLSKTGATSLVRHYITKLNIKSNLYNGHKGERKKGYTREDDYAAMRRRGRELLESAGAEVIAAAGVKPEVVNLMNLYYLSNKSIDAICAEVGQNKSGVVSAIKRARGRIEAAKRRVMSENISRTAAVKRTRVA